MIRAVVYGASGHMGRIVKEKLEQDERFEVCASVAYDLADDPEHHVYHALADVKEKADVLIDFSFHAAAAEIMAYCVAADVPAVICTTGQTEEEKAVIVKASEKIPVFFSANMSIGIAALKKIVHLAVKMFPDADIEIVEAHHNRKKDVPSGTALMLADEVKDVRKDAVFDIGRHENGARMKNEVGIHSLRMGNEAGMHEVIIDTENERLVLKHEVHNRAVFADGALAAAEWLVRQPAGLYDMEDLSGE
jgi:4-hydroxy-tetrahydrodipicolinate reductase